MIHTIKNIRVNPCNRWIQNKKGNLFDKQEMYCPTSAIRYGGYSIKMKLQMSIIYKFKNNLK